MILNEGQLLARDKTVQYAINDSPFNYFLLQGVAGSGKTTTVAEIIDRILYLKPGIAIAMTAPTHTAVKILKSASRVKEEVTFATIHSLCSFKQNINYVTGKVTYVRDENRSAKIERMDIIVVDEASMLDSYMFKTIEYFRNRNNLKVIFVGDVEQLEPIGEVMSKVFMPENQIKSKIGKCALTEVVRQAKDNPIIAYATAIRLDQKFMGRGIKYLPIEVEPVMEKLKKYFVTEEFANDSNYAKVLAYRNITVNRFNAIIRELVYDSKNLPKILEKDCLIADKPIIKFNPLINKWQMIMSTNEDMRVVDMIDDNHLIQVSYMVHDAYPYEVTPASKLILEALMDSISSTDKLKLAAWNEIDPLTIYIYEWKKYTETFRVYNVVVEHIVDDEPVEHVINILHESDQAKFDKIQNSIKNAALNQKTTSIRGKLWIQYYALENHFAWVKYNYAITVHKSQGSTYQNVIVHEWDIDTQKDAKKRKKLRYVAATRASQRLYICKQINNDR